MSKVHIVIPARYGSSRLPGKPLRDIAGKPMIWHVWQRAAESGYSSIVVATDDQQIVDAVERFGGKAVMTSREHASGSDRLAEVATKFAWDDQDIVVNLQGDEPLLDPALLVRVAQLAESATNAGLATLVSPIYAVDDLVNPNVVKAVFDQNKTAHYFSRAPIPWPRDAFAISKNAMPEGDYFRHIGLYAYRVGVLKSIPQMPASPLESIECLEQLRPLQHGVEIKVAVVDKAPEHGVDTEQDLARVIERVERQLISA
ncbi:3-deoxy-manno-octulosonate cytidylyltransferase [Agarivorans sp. OAG1]|uniref:3-deoxy-manno-octulosonate cytidylyltransferase n=1 Tax=Agarivorans sp. OAG1 TaxID=3082387 RepID=UPI002B2999F2|nr:3-deoxy-manno-octulosonate cytidylyltransferase [Agarivorans sp. OAG1]